MPTREPTYETRWYVDGARNGKGRPIHFSEERMARAFALPGQTVTPVRRRIYDPDETLEFVLNS